MHKNTVVQLLILEWVKNNKPKALKKLALKARVSESTLKKIIAGYTPAKLITRNRVAKVFNKTEEELFSRK
ncbi:MAG: hypothetical protein ACOYOK_09050 [Pseudobdellovibrionaceae bacterium]